MEESEEKLRELLKYYPDLRIKTVPPRWHPEHEPSGALPRKITLQQNTDELGATLTSQSPRMHPSPTITSVKNIKILKPA